MSDARISERLKQGVAVVTGAGDGLGRALALGLVTQGVTVVGFGRNAASLAETARLANGSFHAMPVDVSDPAAVSEAFARITESLGAVTLLINNAAVYPRLEFLQETPASFMQTVAINLGGVVACSHAALRGMVQDGFGRIVNVSTFADIAPLPASAGYSVSKGAARILTKALVADLGDRFPDIVVNDWMPGMLDTEMGIPNGLPPETAAQWGVALALWHDPSLRGTMFEMNREVLAPRSLRKRLADTVLRRQKQARLLA
jgi:NAD(P)-dependent dehydrogenase (short-subunit alcohol dehydrogenase family)